MTKVTGWGNGLSQDYDKGLGRWFADRLGARQQLRRDFEMTQQHITQEQETQIAAQFAEDATYEFNIANAAIKHYIDQCAKELPVLPAHITDVLVITGPSTHKYMQAGQYYYTTSQAQAYGQQCAAHARELALNESIEAAIDACGFNGVSAQTESHIRQAIEALKGK